MKNILCLISLVLMVQFTNAQSKNYYIVIYGGTSAGVAAAIQSSRMSKSVALIEPTNRIGGLTTGDLGQTDIGNKQDIGGISREFYKNIKTYQQIGSDNKNQNMLMADRPEREKTKTLFGPLRVLSHLS